ncbi:hypothetical protein FE784_40575, partial [Paenibacillus hemerocallicola]
MFDKYKGIRDEADGAGPVERSEEARKEVSRRSLLITLGMGGAVLAGSAAVGAKLSYADGASSEEADGGRSMLQVANISELLAISPDSLKQGQLVYVGGYNRSGDGGGKLVRWNADSTKTDNGGTVHNPAGGKEARWAKSANSRDMRYIDGGYKGRFEVVHNGIGDFR